MLDVQNVYKTFNPGTVNEKAALRGVSLTLNDGDFVTVIGGNGAGKSTLLNAVAGVWPVDSGSISIGGADVTHLAEYKRAKYIGRVFQDPMMGTAATMQIEENLALVYLRANKHRTIFGITNKERDFFRSKLAELNLGLEDRLKIKVGLLSGGQRQALTLLMATMITPKLLLLDEPAAGMNPNETAELMDTIRFVRDNFDMTVLLIEHDMKLVSGICEKLTVLNFGQVLTFGETSEVLNDKRVITAYLGE